MRNLLFLCLIIVCCSLNGQNKTFGIAGSYYRLENLDSLNKYSLDSVKGELQYYDISDSIVEGIIFPIMIYKTFNDWTKTNAFSFIRNDKYFVDHIESKGKLIKVNENRYYTKLKFFKRDIINIEKEIEMNLSLLANIDVKKDSIWINDKLFKSSSNTRIFQSFTGY